MKKALILLLILAALTSVFSGCATDAEPGDPTRGGFIGGSWESEQSGATEKSASSAEPSGTVRVTDGSGNEADSGASSDAGSQSGAARNDLAPKGGRRGGAL